MSLKNFTEEIFQEYGFTENDIRVYLTYLGTPRATVSEVYLYLETEAEENEELEPIEYDTVSQITNSLVEKGFLKKLEGIVERYIVLEPFFELFTDHSAGFRTEIGKIKDNVLTDQSNRFEKLEAIQDKSIEEVINAVDTQVDSFFQDADSQNSQKKEIIDKARERFTTTNKTLESDLHQILDRFDSDISNISETIVNKNEQDINKTKDNLTDLISKLLDDFSNRVDNLETELKKELDSHVNRHESTANELKPKMELILEKYLDRMDKIIADLKERISKLLNTHIEQVKTTTESLQEDLKNTFDERHQLVKNQTEEFRERAVLLIDNLVEISNRFSDLSDDLASRGSAFKSLFLGKHKKYKARYSQVKEDIESIAKPLKGDFVGESEEYVNTNQTTTKELKSDVDRIMEEKRTTIREDTTTLNEKAQEEINAQLETLATDLAGEIDDTLQRGVKDCSDTTIKLKDSLENSLTQHHRQYDDSIKRYKDDALRMYNEFDSDFKRKNQDYTRDVDSKVTDAKSDLSDKIDGEIRFWDDKSTNMNRSIETVLEDHKNKYKDNAKTLEKKLSDTTRDTTQTIKDAIADFTLEFMNSIDDATELAEKNEEKLNDIHKAAADIAEVANISTWHTIGKDALIATMKDAIYRVKSSVIVVMPVVEPEILQTISEFAFQKKSARFMLTSRFDMDTYGSIINKMKQLGNIQFRQLASEGEYYAVTRDAEEVILCPFEEKEANMISIISSQEAYARLYSQFIGPIFQANSRPIK
ncbi:MAG: hypothetical protein BAJALOKI2v1_30068 [Promethearchaeota archaeon]|nr:MAG: hypothetical protein BAJALOKI2v1_30068 [Candidatus Lokiarchaeota archaeon]